MKYIKISKLAITSDVEVKSAFVALFLVSQGMSPSTFPPPHTVPCAHKAILSRGPRTQHADGTHTARCERREQLYGREGFIKKSLRHLRC